MTFWRKAWWILRYLGPRVVWLRLGVYGRKALGHTRRVFASRPWESLTLADLCRHGTPLDRDDYAAFRNENSPAFLFPLGRPPRAEVGGMETRRPPHQDRLEGLREMHCVYTFHSLSPEPIDWHRNPFENGRTDPSPLWCDVPLYREEQGDPRMMWEPSRAAWALDWALAAARGVDDAADGLWRWIDFWLEANPPYHGIQWWCGQESSVRLLAILIGAWACGELNGERWVKLLRLAWATGYRVEHHINYAISQKNNHAISEALGLMLVGHLFPELRESGSWFKRGRAVMMQELRRQCYGDGSYLQHSMNYHRVMLEGAMLGVRLAELAGNPMDRDIYELLGKAAEFLHQMTDPHTGFTPNYGNNDGAHIFPLSECDFRDVRPAAQAAYYLAHRQRLLPRGPWDGELLWLLGGEALGDETQAPTEVSTLKSRSFEIGGYHTLRDLAGDSWMMTRCHSYRDRMSQCDTLHLDLWAGGVNWLSDSGTYRYSIPGQEVLERYFGCQAAHNVLQLDGRDASEKVGRFLIFPWSKARCAHRESADGSGGYIEGVSEDYQRRPWNCLWKRVILSFAEGIWVVVDDLIASGEHKVRWWWHLCPGEHVLDRGSGGFPCLAIRPEQSGGRTGMMVVGLGEATDRASLITAREAEDRVAAIAAGDEGIEPQGVASPYYGHRRFIPVLQVDRVGELPMRTVSVINTNGEAGLCRETDQEWEISLPSGVHRLSLSEVSGGSEHPIVLSNEFQR